MAEIREKPLGWHGLDLSVEASIARGSLSRASGVRYEERGTIISRPGRKRHTLVFSGGIPGQHIYAAEPFEGAIGFRDETLWSQPGSPPFPLALKYVYKSEGRLWLWDTTQTAPVALGPSLPGYITGQWYANRLYIVDGASPPKVLMRRPDVDQAHGTPIKYGLERMGLDFPTTSDRPILAVSSPGFINPSSDPFEAQQVYRVRVGFRDHYGRTSNPSLPSLPVTVSPSDQNKTLIVNWQSIARLWAADLTAIRAEVKEVQLWLQMSVSGTISSYVLVAPEAVSGAFDPASGSYSGGVTIVNLNGVEEWDTLEAQHGFDHGYPPILADIAINKDVAYGIASPDVVYREVGPSAETLTRRPRPQRYFQLPFGEGLSIDINTGTLVRRPPGGPQPPPTNAPTRASKYEVRAMVVRSTALFIGKALSPDYTEEWVNVGRGGEELVAVETFGSGCAAYTDRTIYVFTPEGGLQQTLSPVGAGARDSVVPYRGGHAFLASDATLQFFNGATSEPLAREIAPLFGADTWTGPYARFDKDRIREVRGCYARNRLYYTLPLVGGGRALLVIDSTFGDTLIALDDGADYVQVGNVPGQDRVLGISGAGAAHVYWYFIDEGTSDEAPQPAGSFPGGDAPIAIDVRTMLVPLAEGHEGAARRFALDLDPGQNEVTVLLTVDDDPSLSIAYAFSGAGRREERRYLPPYFKGRFLRVRVTGGSLYTPIRLYGLRLLGDRRGDL